MYLGRYDEARRATAHGRRLLSRAGDRVSLARLLNNEGNLWHRLDLPQRALTFYRDAVRALERAGDARSARMIGTNVGNCLSMLGRCDEARAHYRASRRAHEAADAASEALNSSYNLAYLDFLEHRDEAALIGLAKVREEALERGIPSLAALATMDRSEIFLRMGAHEEASPRPSVRAWRAPRSNCTTRRARRSFSARSPTSGWARPLQPGAVSSTPSRSSTREGNRVWTGEALLGLATIWWKDGNPRAAAALLSAARRCFAAAGDRERVACAATLESRAFLATGDLRAARVALREGERGGRGSARLDHLRLAAGAALARREGDIDKARRLLDRASDAAEKLAARILDEQWRATFWGEWGWPHRERAALELAEGDFAAALEALEAGRGRALLGRSTRRTARGADLPASVRRWAASRHARERARRAGESVAMGRPEPAGATLRRTLATRPPRAIGASQLQRALPEGTLLIDYLVHDGVLGALAVSRDELRGNASLVSESQLTQQTQALLFALRGAAYRPAGGRGHDAALEQQLAELASLSLWPLLRGRVPRGLALAPAGPLARVPWAALPLPDGRALCEACETVVVPGLRLGLSRRASAPFPAGAPLVVASDAGELESVRPETEALMRAFPGATLLAGADATAARFLELAQRAPWIHFAGHGGWRADAPQESGIRLHDRWLLAGELAEHTLQARWVTLSACHTARALVHPGEEWFGLARSFLLAGAGAVVAAQWDVEDAPTAELMADLYDRLAGGTPLARALAQAQAARRATGAHPYDWAGFVALAGPGLLSTEEALPAPGTPGGGSHVPRKNMPEAGLEPGIRQGGESAKKAYISIESPRGGRLDSLTSGGARQ